MGALRRPGDSIFGTLRGRPMCPLETQKCHPVASSASAARVAASRPAPPPVPTARRTPRSTTPAAGWRLCDRPSRAARPARIAARPGPVTAAGRGTPRRPAAARGRAPSTTARPQLWQGVTRSAPAPAVERCVWRPRPARRRSARTDRRRSQATGKRRRFPDCRVPDRRDRACVGSSRCRRTRAAARGRWPWGCPTRSRGPSPWRSGSR